MFNVVIPYVTTIPRDKVNVRTTPPKKPNPTIFLDGFCGLKNKILMGSI